MKRKLADKYFNALYDATYDDAVAYIIGKSGDAAVAKDVLFDTYSCVYDYLRNKDDFYDDELTETFFDNLKKAMKKHITTNEESTPLNILSNMQKINEIVESEFELSEKDATENMLDKKAHSFVMQKSTVERRAFILYFYEGHSTNRISQILNIPEQQVCGHIQSVLLEIRNNFLSSYQAEGGKI